MLGGEHSANDSILYPSTFSCDHGTSVIDEVQEPIYGAESEVFTIAKSAGFTLPLKNTVTLKLYYLEQARIVLTLGGPALICPPEITYTNKRI